MSAAPARARRPALPASAGPRLDALRFDVAQIVPAQLPRRGAHPGVRALLAELLRAALRDAGVVRTIAPVQPRRQALAVAWLTGTLDAEVALPVTFVCDALGLDAGVLAAAVRARALP